MDQYNITGMSCAACSARVEKAVGAVPGVTACSVSLLTNSMSVEGTASAEAVIAAVEKAGYGAVSKESGKTEASVKSPIKDAETRAITRRLVVSAGLLSVLMYFSMGHMMFGLPVMPFFEQNHVAMGLLQLLVCAAVMVINQRFFINGFKGLLHRAPNMDTLVALGSGASFVWSTYALFAMADAQFTGDFESVAEYMHELYFESAAMILVLITVGKMLESRAKGKTTDALRALVDLAPKYARVIKDGREVSVPVEQVIKGDIFVVRPGEGIPVDAVVTEGISAVDESALTGESIPVDKAAGDTVSAGTLNCSGFLRCEAKRVGADTMLSQIIRTVSDAAATKAPIAKIADKVSGVFVPVVISIAAVTVIAWLIAGYDAGFALARGISVLVISCPCALGLATPVAIMVGSGIGAKNGILFKTAESLEYTGKANIVALDKTGTVTKGEPSVTDIIAYGVSEDEFLSYAYSLELKSEHPLARAIVSFGKENAVREIPTEGFKAFPGNGLFAETGENEIFGGSVKFIDSMFKVPQELKVKAEGLADMGKTPLVFTKNGEVIGMVAVCDTVKSESAQAVRELGNMGLRVVMLTGDNEKTAKAIAAQAVIEEVIAGLLPEGKESVIKKLKQQGRVIMVGDGINDAPALTRANIGIAIGAGTDVAVDAADVVLVNSKLTDVPAAIRLSRAVLKNIRENLFWAFFYNCVGIPLAAGLFISAFGWKLNPMFGAAAMSLSSFCVVMNALRLNFLRAHSTKHDKKIKQKNKTEKETIPMEKTMKIEGMMCGHCSARVKKALEELPEVNEAVVSHETGTAVVKLNSAVSDEILKNAVEAQGYTVL